MDQQRNFALTEMRKSVEKLGSSAEVSSICHFLWNLLTLCS